MVLCTLQQWCEIVVPLTNVYVHVALPVAVHNTPDAHLIMEYIITEFLLPMIHFVLLVTNSYLPSMHLTHYTIMQ